MKIEKRKHKVTASSQPIMAAGEEGFENLDEEFNAPESYMDDEDAFDDTLDEMADNIEDMQDTLDEVQEDDVDIEVDNNIDGHLIAECDKCHGIFISAMVESDQEVEKISGICPLCEKESDQFIKWVVKAIE